MNKVLFIYFDVGGVLIDWSRVFETAAARFNLTPEDIWRVFDEDIERITKGFITPQQLWKQCIEKYDIRNAHNYDFLDTWVSDNRPIQEMHSLVNTIQSDYKIGLLSNIYKGMLPLLLEKKLIPDIRYSQILFSCDIGMMKPDSDIYALAQKKADVNPNNILLVDDRTDYLAGAKKAQWQTFLFDNKQRAHSAKELEEYIRHY